MSYFGIKTINTVTPPILSSYSMTHNTQSTGDSGVTAQGYMQNVFLRERIKIIAGWTAQTLAERAVLMTLINGIENKSDITIEFLDDTTGTYISGSFMIGDARESVLIAMANADTVGWDAIEIQFIEN